MTQLTRRGLLTGALGVGSLALLGSQWPRLTGADIPGRRDDSLLIAILGTNQDAAARQSWIVLGFVEGWLCRGGCRGGGGGSSWVWWRV